MPSTFFGLNISYSGLVASNAALNTTANNISNVDTEGYSKQVVNTQASNALRVFAKYGCAGAGVDTLSVERLRNEYYDQRYRSNQANVGQYDVKQEYMKILENYFADDEYTVGFNTIFNNMFSSMEEVMKNAGDTTYKQAFVKDATSMTEYFNKMFDALQSVQKDLNTEIKATVDQVNALAGDIATINKQINVIELSGGIANDLRDQRDKLVDQLSELVDVTTSEEPIYDTSNPDSPRETGATNYIVKIAGGQSIVNGNDYRTIELSGRTVAQKVNQSDVDGLYDLKWSDGINFDLNNGQLGGTLKGLIDMRDGNNGEYFHGAVAKIGVDNTGGVSRQTVTISVDNDYLQDINKSNLSESGQIRINNTICNYDSFAFEFDEATGSYNYTFTLSAKDKENGINIDAVGTDTYGKNASVGIANDYQGIPYYMQQMNEWVRDFAKSFNEILTQTGSVTDDGQNAQLLFTGNNTTGEQYSFEDMPAKGVTNYTIASSANTYYRLTAGNFNINSNIEYDASRLATHTDAYAGQDKYDVIEQLIDLQTNKEKMSFRGCSSSEFLQCIMSDVALNANSANTFKDKYDDLGNTIDTMRMSISSVDQDEEAVSLVKYQNAYTLASKMISTFQEVYNRLILETGV